MCNYWKIVVQLLYIGLGNNSIYLSYAGFLRDKTMHGKFMYNSQF